MIHSGKHIEYYWIEILSNDDNMKSLIYKFPEFILDKYLAIVSFDSDSFLPTKSELNRGWIYENEIAYFDQITESELSQDSLFDIYDQWLIFDNRQRFNSMDIYVNFSGFSVDMNESRKTFELSVTKRFWNEVDQIKPQKFILNGDKFIIGTNNQMEFEKVKSIYSLNSKKHLG